MNNTDIQSTYGGFSMRRTFLTLLGGIAAFGILTASYATADLPDQASLGSTPVIVAD